MIAPLVASSAGRIAVAVSGAGSNLRALVEAERQGTLGGRIVLVVADRPCPALAWAAEEGIDTALVPGGPDGAVRDALDGATPDIVVLAGYLRIVGPRTLEAYAGRILNVHPSLLPAFPGAHAVQDALRHGVQVTGVTVHRVDATLDGGPIVAQEALAILDGDDEASLLDRLHAVEHRLLPRVVAATLGGDDRPPRRALLSVSDKTGLVAFAGALVRHGFELISTGGTARALRDAGLAVIDVAAVTGFPEMLDGRVKTLHPRIHAGILADRRRADHRAVLRAAGIHAFEVVVVNLYPFAAAAERPGTTIDELIEEIDIGGPSLIRAAAKNQASVAVVVSPARYPAVVAALDADGAIPAAVRAALAIEAFRLTAAYDARVAAELPSRLAAAGIIEPDEPGTPGAADPYPPLLTVALEKVETLRYGENPHQPAARYRRPGATDRDGPFATDRSPLQGKPLSYNNVLDASAAATIARTLRGPAAVVVKHLTPCGAAERGTLEAAWRDALAGDPVSAFGGVVALTRTVDGATAAALREIFLEVVVAPSFDPAAQALLAERPNLRLVLDPALDGVNGAARGSERDGGSSPFGAIRSAGGAVLVSAADSEPDDPASWTVATRRPPTAAERRDLDLAWRLVRGALSNAIVVVRDGRLIGVGSGQTSRLDAARIAVEKARTFARADALDGAAAASDAFFPFPDGAVILLDAGVAAIVQPGGSVRDSEVIAAVDAIGATMLTTGVRHFRH
ncbi:MAG: bifunctional phosphoribosylaminoimidazolecarboxamide formyltransferase/IMP cyclohydrolase [Candidatus Limnocylindrales bacterium]